MMDTLEKIWKEEGRLCGLVVRVPGYRSRGHGFGSRRYQIFMRINEELLEWKSSGFGSRNPRLTTVGIR
jgi:hypothetical protein